MLLFAQKKDDTIEEMTGANWTIKVAKLMESNDLTKGTSKLGSAALTPAAALPASTRSLTTASTRSSRMRSSTRSSGRLSAICTSIWSSTTTPS